ncbi:MAG: glucose 1-dehydrogenase [Salinisphaera sp.]|nr:glucose 1-dehydrogenase [Salinisphaera sp.]
MNYANAFRVNGKAALVTGAARGIGAAAAEALAQSGASVLVTDILEDAGQETVERICSAGGQAEFLKQDVTSEAQWEQATQAVVDRFGRYDILVNNAGIETAALVSQCTLEDFKRVQDINVNAVFLGIKHAVRAMSPDGAAGQGGSIINLSSVAGIIGTAAHVAYHSSKGAVRLMTKATAIECAALQSGIRVNSIHPGVVETQMGSSFVEDFVTLGLAPDSQAADAAIKAMHPMGYGQVEDIACAIIYLASEASRWVNGAELVLDGGLTAQ